jgi:hypothetical protein
MRFHSNFKFIKRNVAAPETKSFIVKSDIRNRYAITEVTSIVFNPANVNQIYNFGFVMPEQALVSDVSITRIKDSNNVPSSYSNNLHSTNIKASNFTKILISALRENDMEKIENKNGRSECERQKMIGKRKL